MDRKWVLERLEDGVCEVTGIAFDYATGHGQSGRARRGPSIDRIDSTIGYVKCNCQVVVYQCNVAKGPWGQDAFVKFIRQIAGRLDG